MPCDGLALGTGMNSCVFDVIHNCPGELEVEMHQHQSLEEGSQLNIDAQAERARQMHYRRFVDGKLEQRWEVGTRLHLNCSLQSWN